MLFSMWAFAVGGAADALCSPSYCHTPPQALSVELLGMNATLMSQYIK